MDIVDILKRHGCHMSQEQLMHFKKEFHRHYKSNAEVEHVFQIRRKQEKDGGCDSV